MKLSQLVELQRVGALKVGENSNNKTAIIGGVQMTNEQAVTLAQKLGWTGRKADCGYKMIEKTAKFVKAMNNVITDVETFNSADLYFESIPRSNCEKIVDRIVFKTYKYNFTVIHGESGLGGSWALFNKDVSQSVPIYACASMKMLGTYINDKHVGKVED
jgi:hypothetical protein